MSEHILNTKIQLRHDTEANFELVKESFLPLAGEVCLVDTELYGLRTKVGDGTHVYKDLEFTDATNTIVVRGYYYNNDFYKDSTYLEAVKLEKCARHLYIDLNTNGKQLYVCDGLTYFNLTPQATDALPGVMKLYKTHGDNEDGTMTQKSITDGVNAIKFAVDAVETECLVLDLPWS